MTQDQIRALRAFIETGACDKVFGRARADIALKWARTKPQDSDARNVAYNTLQALKEAEGAIGAIDLENRT